MTAENNTDDTFAAKEMELLLKPVEFEEKASSQENKDSFFHLPLFQWKAFFLFLGCCVGIIIQWILTSETFAIPKDVAKSRSEFFQAKDRYLNNRTYWDAKENNFINAVRRKLTGPEQAEALNELAVVAPEILISFLVQELKISPDRLETIAIHSKQGHYPAKLIMSKLESGIWPFQIMLSIEMELRIVDGRFTIDFRRLRRGNRDIALGLAWTYFGPELEMIRPLELFTFTQAN